MGPTADRVNTSLVWRPDDLILTGQIDRAMAAGRHALQIGTILGDWLVEASARLEVPRSRRPT
jgi:hypothetical protein